MPDSSIPIRNLGGMGLFMISIKLKKGSLALLLSLIFVFAPIASVYALEVNNEADGLPETVSGVDADLNNSFVDVGYSEYIQKYEASPMPDGDIVIEGQNSQRTSATHIETLDGRACTIIPEGTGAAWDIAVPEHGLYEISITYYPVKGKNRNIEAALSLDGEIPYQEMSQLVFPRIWRDADKIKTDALGNQLRPGQEESPRWDSILLRDCNGYYEEPLLIYLEAGNHRLRLDCKAESLAISEIVLANAPPPLSLAAVGLEYEKPAQPFRKIYQAESTFEKSSSMLYPTADRTSASTQPNHYYYVRLNTIGQNTWKYIGQWISWEIEVPEDGLYQLGFKVRQSYSQGLNSYRTLYIDGKLPYQEAESIAFPYNLDWYIQTAPGPVYLTKGLHEIRMESVAGPTAKVRKGLGDTVLLLNDVYRSIIFITGTSPDIYRTFDLEAEIPNLMSDLQQAKAQIEDLSSLVRKLTKTNGSEASIIDQVDFLLQTYLDDPSQIPVRLSKFRDNISSLGSLIQLMSEQPLEMDYFVVSSQTEMPDAKANLWESLKFIAQSFFSSFVNDYNSVGNAEGSSGISVWIHGGRDQAQVMRTMVDDLFTAKTGIRVNLNLVEAGSTVLMQAILAGKGPDAALGVSQDMPVNLAMRGALADLSGMGGFNEIKPQFYPSAWVPYQYRGGIYAIPETQVFDMLFYRTDILEKLGLSPPKTWTEFYAAVAVLQKNNLYAGIPETDSENPGVSAGIGTFAKMLYQNGGEWYNKSLTETAFNTREAYKAFTDWINLYKLYGLERQFNFYSMFRSGEMPLAIQPYSMYNMLSQAAPEIRGLWGFTCVPGTLKENGTVDVTELSSGSACIIMRRASNPEDVFEFLAWWTGSDVQARYGNELESILGPSARYATANRQAFSELPWTTGEMEILITQWESAVNVPQIPGSYFVSRCLTNALRTAISQDVNPVNTLNKYAKEINAELERKRKEFGENT